MENSLIKEKFRNATQSFIDKVKDDINVIAVIIHGSLAYDVVWEKSDIDMTVIVRDQKLETRSLCVIEDGITFNVTVIPRSTLKRNFERMVGGSIPQAYFAKGEIVYTTDDTLYDYLEDIRQLGSDDIALSVFNLSSTLVDIYDKCEKWLTVKKDPLYAQFYLLKAAEIIAKMELIMTGEIPIRESIQKVTNMNPQLMKTFYEEPMSHYLSENEILDGIESINQYLEEHLDIISKPIIEYLSDHEIKTVTMISQYLHLESSYIIGTLNYLAEKGVIEKVSQTIRLTPRGKLAIEEIGYLYLY